MNTERDIIIERLEKKLAERDEKIAKMHEELRESITIEIEKRFADKIRLRESTLDELRMKFNEKFNGIIEMNKTLRDSLLEQQKSEDEIKNAIKETEKRMDRIERRLVELNSAYDGVMKELLDQKSILQGLLPKQVQTEKPKQEEKSKDEDKTSRKPDSKGEYIVAENYVPETRKKKQIFIEADEKTAAAEDNRPKRGTLFERTEILGEGVEIFETPRKR